MAITSLVDGITGIGPTGIFTTGANTVAPYNGVQITGLTDGTSAATASKNPADFYNELLFDKRIIIEKAGLDFDPADNSQLLRAIQKLANYSPQSYGTFASVQKPTAAPSEANPATVLTNTNGEVFAWSGNVAGWVLIANGYMAIANAGAITVANGVTSIINAATCPHDGFVIVSFGVQTSSSQNTAKYVSLNLPGNGFDNFSGSYNNVPIGVYDSQSGVTMWSVSAGQVISIGFSSFGGATNVASSTLLIKYI